jgi:hypothetical protein
MASEHLIGFVRASVYDSYKYIIEIFMVVQEPFELILFVSNSHDE